VPFGAQGSKISASGGAAGDGDKGGTSGFSLHCRKRLTDDLAQAALQTVADRSASKGLRHNNSGHQFDRFRLINRLRLNDRLSLIDRQRLL
jgi:hypothetical protein